MRGTLALARNEPQTQAPVMIARSHSWQAKSATIETAFGSSAGFDFGKTPIYPPPPTPVTTTREGCATGSGQSFSEAPRELMVTGGPTPGQVGDLPPPVKTPAPEPPVMEDPAPSEPIPATRVAVDTITANIGPTGTNIAHVPPCGAQPP